MPIAIIEQRLKIAQTALAYICNILQQRQLRLILDAFDVVEHTLRIFIAVDDMQDLLDALCEIAWHMHVSEISVENNEAIVLVDLRKELE